MFLLLCHLFIECKRTWHSICSKKLINSERQIELVKSPLKSPSRIMETGRFIDIKMLSTVRTATPSLMVMMDFSPFDLVVSAVETLSQRLYSDVPMYTAITYRKELNIGQHTYIKADVVIMETGKFVDIRMLSAMREATPCLSNIVDFPASNLEISACDTIMQRLCTDVLVYFEIRYRTKISFGK